MTSVPDPPPSTGRRRTFGLLWLVAYACFVLGVVVTMLQVRRVTLTKMATPQAQADWDAWREAPPNVRDDLPVKRRPPSSDEPPSLVLLRDHFAVMMAAAVVFGSLLFATVSLAARGALSRDAGGTAADESDTRSRRGVGRS